jgi:hypothetical protein
MMQNRTVQEERAIMLSCEGMWSAYMVSRRNPCARSIKSDDLTTYGRYFEVASEYKALSATSQREMVRGAVLAGCHTRDFVGPSMRVFVIKNAMEYT